MRTAFSVLAVVALVGIGTAEALVSNEQLAQLPGRGRPAFSAGGGLLTVVGILLSAGVYAAWGLFLARDGADEGAAFRMGMAVGALAGLAGGAIRAYLIHDYLAGVLEGYGLADLLGLTLGTFVALATLISAAAGASVTWLGFRGGRRRQTPRPPR